MVIQLATNLNRQHRFSIINREITKARTNGNGWFVTEFTENGQHKESPTSIIDTL